MHFLFMHVVSREIDQEHVSTDIADVGVTFWDFEAAVVSLYRERDNYANLSTW